MFSVWMRGFSYLLNVGSVLCFLMGFDSHLIGLLDSSNGPLVSTWRLARFVP